MKVTDRYPGLSKEEAYKANDLATARRYRQRKGKEFFQPGQRKYKKSEEYKKLLHNLYHTNSEFRIKHLARVAVRNAIRDRRLVRCPCEVCGNPKSEAHHEDYSKPLEVKWLCKEHHIEHH